jgi:hypothetical protein
MSRNRYPARSLIPTQEISWRSAPQSGHVLGAVDHNGPDRYERDYIGTNIKIQPRYDRFIQSSDPSIRAQIMAAKRGDLVLVTGVEKNRGRNVRIQTFKVLKAAPPALTLVENASGTSTVSTATEAVAA